MMRFISILLLSVLCFVSAALGDLMWYYGGNTATNLEIQTGQSSEGLGLQVDWKDAAIKLTAPH
ncbi:MAG: hypothetical protein V2A34_15940, partial [Lentisphaerota bacterium]